jgi:hypothetical protein
MKEKGIYKWNKYIWARVYNPCLTTTKSHDLYAANQVFSTQQGRVDLCVREDDALSFPDVRKVIIFFLSNSYKSSWLQVDIFN